VTHLMPGWEALAPDRAAQEFGAGQLHLWWLPLDDPPLEFDRIVATLDALESERAQRFKFDSDRRRFQCARGLVRTVLASYCRMAPAELRFDYATNGKPGLSGMLHERRIEFNLSHSGAYALLGVAEQHALGVDLELERPVLDFERIAQDQFAPGEWAQLSSLRPERRLAAFLAGWTRKEAFVKAQGEGLSTALDSFVVSLDPDCPASLLSIQGSAQAASAWTLWGLKPTPVAWAAVAIEARDMSLRHLHFAG
jgi:4'-phosphopantetheinyl transferase